jgi:hypothetical protein
MISRLCSALRAFFKALSDPAFADRISAPSPTPTAQPQPQPAPAPQPPPRSDALTLLATFQREARLVDFLLEPIQSYTDAQIGAAVRDLHKNAAAVLTRYFDPKPLRPEPENAPIAVPPGFEPFEFHLTGNVVGSPPYHGALRHHGWKATKCDLPTWTGPTRAARIIAPAEVELP